MVCDTFSTIGPLMPQLVAWQTRQHWALGMETPQVLGTSWHLREDMGMDQYLLIPFLGEWTSINPSYFDVHQGYKVLTHCHMAAWQYDAIWQFPTEHSWTDASFLAEKPLACLSPWNIGTLVPNLKLGWQARVVDPKMLGMLAWIYAKWADKVHQTISKKHGKAYDI